MPCWPVLLPVSYYRYWVVTSVAQNMHCLYRAAARLVCPSLSCRRNQQQFSSDPCLASGGRTDTSSLTTTTCEYGFLHIIIVSIYLMSLGMLWQPGLWRVSWLCLTDLWWFLWLHRFRVDGCCCRCVRSRQSSHSRQSRRWHVMQCFTTTWIKSYWIFPFNVKRLACSTTTHKHIKSNGFIFDWPRDRGVGNKAANNRLSAARHNLLDVLLHQLRNFQHLS